MAITIDFPPNDLARLKEMTRVDDDAQAVVQAAREYMRIVGLRELRKMSGNVEFEETWRELDRIELEGRAPFEQ